MRLLGLIATALALFLATPAAADYADGVSAYRNGDYKTALANFLPEAKAGDSRAQLGIALIYHKGHGVSANPKEAMKWYRKAADQGNPTAQNNLGVIYRYGEGVEKNPREAFSWIWMAAMQGYAKAELNLADLYRAGEGVPADAILAYVWLQFAIEDLPANAREVANRRKADLIAEMTPVDVERAERMTKAMRSSRFGG